MRSVSDLKIHLYADGADKNQMLDVYSKGQAKGFTTNPTLMAKANIKDYAQFAQAILEVIRDLPISFEVFSDEFPEMERQANIIASWGSNVNVKIPITNTKSENSFGLIQKLLLKNIKLNVTAILTMGQVEGLREVLRKNDDVIISIFAGRIADTGRDPMPLMKKAVEMFQDFPKVKILWASPREVLNVYQADECGCHIITATPDLIKKMVLRGKDLDLYSLETVKMFYNDACSAGFSL